MKTNFIHTRVRVAPGLELVVDGNSKITAGNGSFEQPAPNALSLPAASVDWAGPSCPGSTPTCRASCYVRGLAKHAPDVYAAYHENLSALTWLLDRPGTREESARRLGTWIALNARGGFRWHVSGDVLNAEHAYWIVEVCRHSRDVNHWIYTRTFSAVPALTCAPNLVVNISADVDNYAEARRVATLHGLRVCYEATCDGAVPADLPAGDAAVIFPDYSLRGRKLERPTSHAWWVGLEQERRRQTCPADFYGQSDAMRCGPCSKCLTPVTS
jgi:hypothetical protein